MLFLLDFSKLSICSMCIFVWCKEACVCVHPHFPDMKLTAAEEEYLRWRWQCAVGPRYEVTVRVCVDGHQK